MLETHWLVIFQVEFRNNDFKEGLVAKLVEIWKNDPYENVSRESYVTLRYINAI